MFTVSALQLPNLTQPRLTFWTATALGMSFLFVVYIPMKKKQQREVPAEMKPTAVKREDTDKVLVDVPDIVTPSSVQPTVIAEDDIDNDDLTRDEFRPFYRPRKRPSVVVRDEVKDVLAALPVPDIPDVMSEQEMPNVEDPAAPGRLSLDEVWLSLRDKLDCSYRRIKCYIAATLRINVHHWQELLSIDRAK